MKNNLLLLLPCLGFLAASSLLGQSSPSDTEAYGDESAMASPMMMFSGEEEDATANPSDLRTTGRGIDRTGTATASQVARGAAAAFSEEDDTNRYLENEIDNNIYTAALARVAKMSLNKKLIDGGRVEENMRIEWEAAKEMAAEEEEELKVAWEKAKKETEAAQEKSDKATLRLHGQEYVDDAYYNYKVKEHAEVLAAARVQTARSTLNAIKFKDTAQRAKAEAKLKEAMSLERAAAAALALDAAKREKNILSKKTHLSQSNHSVLQIANDKEGQVFLLKKSLEKENALIIEKDHQTSILLIQARHATKIAENAYYQAKIARPNKDQHIERSIESVWDDVIKKTKTAQSDWETLVETYTQELTSIPLSYQLTWNNYINEANECRIKSSIDISIREAEKASIIADNAREMIAWSTSAYSLGWAATTNAINKAQTAVSAYQQLINVCLRAPSTANTKINIDNVLKEAEVKKEYYAAQPAFLQKEREKKETCIIN